MEIIIIEDQIIVIDPVIDHATAWRLALVKIFKGCQDIVNGVRL